MKLVVGLGNPGSGYAGTKHNVGFEVIDLVSKKYNINTGKLKFKGFLGDGTVAGERVLLLKPQTFMNLSGESLIETARFYKIGIEDIIVVYDDTSLPLGSVRIREKGSAGGHNGMKNIIAHLGSDNFVRVRIGIGEKPAGWNLADYVLSKFDKDELPLALSGYEKGAQAVELILREGVQKAMNRINISVKERKPKEEKKTEEGLKDGKLNETKEKTSLKETVQPDKTQPDKQ